MNTYLVMKKRGKTLGKHNLVSFFYLIVFKRHKSKTQQGCYFTRRYIMDETVDQHNNSTFSLMEHKEEEKTAVTSHNQLI